MHIKYLDSGLKGIEFHVGSLEKELKSYLSDLTLSVRFELSLKDIVTYERAGNETASDGEPTFK